MIADHNQIESPAKLVPHRTLTEFYPAPAQRAGFVSDLFDRAARGELRVVVGGTYPMSDVRRAHEELQARRTTGKLLLDPAS